MTRKPRDIGTLILQIVIVLVVAVLSFMTYRCSKRINYNRYYRKQVQDTIRQMVKPECLQEGSHE